MKTFRVLLASSLAASTLVTSAAVPASAATEGLSDPSGDVLRYNDAQGIYDEPADHPPADIRTLTATSADTGRGSSTVDLELTVEQAATGGHVLVDFGLQPVDGGRFYTLTPRWGPESADDDPYMHSSWSDASRGDDYVGYFECPGSTFVRAGTTFTATIDTACIGAADTYYVWAAFVHLVDDVGGSGRNAYVDDTDGFTLVMPGHGTRISPPAPIDTTATCDGAPQGRFSDTDGNVHADAIDCVAHLSITSGKGDGRYAPQENLSRGQIATFLVRTLRNAGEELVVPDRDYYTDDDGTTHEENLNIAAANGWLDDSVTTVRPNEKVTRAEMAVSTSAALQSAGYTRWGWGPDYFTDDDTLHGLTETDISTVTFAGIVGGKGGTFYAPDELLTRAQMATFLTRLYTFAAA